MAVTGKDYGHPAVGRYAICRDGKLGLVQVVFNKAEGRPLFVGRRVADNTKWQSSRPVFLSIEETAMISGLDREMAEEVA